MAPALQRVAVLAGTRLAKLLQHFPASIGPSSLADVRGAAGFVRLEAECVECIALVDADLNPPIQVLGYGPDVLFDAASIAERVASAAALRPKGLDARRVVHEAADGFPGLAVDGFRTFAKVDVYSSHWQPYLPTIADALLQNGFAGAYLRTRVRGKPQTCTHLAGVEAPSRLQCEENGARYEVNLGNSLSTGLYLDQRANRAFVSQLAAAGADGGQASVLNLFAHSCSFGVACALAGARTLNSDTDGGWLNVGRRNYALNGLAGDHLFEKECAFDRLAEPGELHDVVIVDPSPSALSKSFGAFSAREHFAGLVALAANSVKPGGHLVVFSNCRSVQRMRFRKSVHAALPKLFGLPDCPPADPDAEPPRLTPSLRFSARGFTLPSTASWDLVTELGQDITDHPSEPHMICDYLNGAAVRRRKDS
ncbi:S-adenosyl-L-methionine-dependent methyltransferase [Pelagophyceae sp. CCMP2097]|nr:S-adenosyl-L-methionine-dependent methyltransferase [Pelagophyceae sp. CCMP2097]